MKYGVWKYFAICSIFFLSCLHKEKLCSVVFPDIISNQIETFVKQHEYTVIIYVDSTGCTPCSFSSISTWRYLQPNFAEQKTGILLIINNSDEQSVMKSLKEHKMTMPFVFDNKRIFKTYNINLFQNTGNIFVIDKNRNVVFTESPIKNEETWNRFVKRIKR